MTLTQGVYKSSDYYVRSFKDSTKLIKKGLNRLPQLQGLDYKRLVKDTFDYPKSKPIKKVLAEAEIAASTRREAILQHGTDYLTSRLKGIRRIGSQTPLFNDLSGLKRCDYETAYARNYLAGQLTDLQLINQEGRYTIARKVFEDNPLITVFRRLMPFKKGPKTSPLLDPEEIISIINGVKEPRQIELARQLVTIPRKQDGLPLLGAKTVSRVLETLGPDYKYFRKYFQADLNDEQRRAIHDIVEKYYTASL